MGLLDVQTDDGTQPLVGDRFPSTNFGAFRVSRNMGARSAIGMIFTDRNGGDTGNRSYGVDVHLRPGGDPTPRGRSSAATTSAGMTGTSALLRAPAAAAAVQELIDDFRFSDLDSVDEALARHPGGRG